MALDDLVGSNAQNYMPFNPNDPSMFRRLDGPLSSMDTLNSNRDHGAWLGDGIGSGGGLATLPEGHLRPQLPQRPHFGNFIGLPHHGLLQQPMPQPDYSSQFENFGETLGGFGEQLTGFGDQMTGYQDALGSFNEQMGGMGKQFETVNNKLDSVEKGIGTLGNQLASFENTQKAQPQNVQPQRPAYNSFGSPFGFGGLGSLFGRRY